MRIEVKAKGKRVVASSPFPKLRVEGATANEAIVALKRASLVELAKQKGDAVLDGVDWHLEPPADGDDVELGVDIDVRETKDGWKYASPGGAVQGVARTLDDARRRAARASWKALAARVADEDFLRAGGMRIGFVVKLTSAWIVDHRAPGMLQGGDGIVAKWTALSRALGKPRFDLLDDDEALYGWGLRGKGEEDPTAWIGVRVRGGEDDARAVAKTLSDVELAASDDDAAASVKRWLKRQLSR